MKKLFLLLALMGVVALGCTKDEEIIFFGENKTFNLSGSGGNVVINYQTNVDCEVIIPEEAQDWITIAPSTRGLVTYNTTLNIAENNSGEQRTCVVKVISQDGNEVLAEYTITQTSWYRIYYTSRDGEIVTPSFNASIRSNTYIDGVGIIEFDSPVTSIGDWAFCYCISLTSVTIPDSVTSIGDGAFDDCESLKSVYCKPTIPPAGGWYMFENNASGRTIYVHKESVNEYKCASYWGDYANAIVGYTF